MDWVRLRSRFEELRRARGMSQEAVGANVGKTAAAISNFERGENVSRLKNLEAYCKAIDAALVMEIVPAHDAELVQRLADLLPWIDVEARSLVMQSIKMAEMTRNLPPAPEPVPVTPPIPMRPAKPTKKSRRR
jgi:transcriptional regulator with XRE-family HTH domain